MSAKGSAWAAWLPTVRSLHYSQPAGPPCLHELRQTLLLSLNLVVVARPAEKGKNDAQHGAAKSSWQQRPLGQLHPCSSSNVRYPKPLPPNPWCDFTTVKRRRIPWRCPSTTMCQGVRRVNYHRPAWSLYGGVRTSRMAVVLTCTRSERHGIVAQTPWPSLRGYALKVAECSAHVLTASN